ncbi:hypothetical protein B484DRAFT_458070, partial [Ochromonadaceae sp. CCMP2298]
MYKAVDAPPKYPPSTPVPFPLPISSAYFPCLFPLPISPAYFVFLSLLGPPLLVHSAHAACLC